jgi:hypothetical protein
MVKMRNACRILILLQEKRPFGRYGHRWEDNIKMDLKEVRGMDEVL